MTEVLRRAVVRDRIGVPAGQRAQQLVERPGMSKLVRGEGGHRHVLLELRGDTRPLAVPEPKDELVVRQGEQELLQSRPCRGIGRAGARGRASAPGRAHLSRAFGLDWPVRSRAAASLSRIT